MSCSRHGSCGHALSHARIRCADQHASHILSCRQVQPPHNIWQCASSIQHKARIYPCSLLAAPARACPCREDSSDEDEYEERRARKAVPAWAAPYAIAQQLLAQAFMDADAVFGMCPDTIDLAAAWAGMPPPGKLDNKGRPRRDYMRRGSSGDWSRDLLSSAELDAYRATMAARPSAV